MITETRDKQTIEGREQKMTITKTFIQKHIATDCEARNWDWVDTKETYENLVEKLANKWNGWFDGIRMVEKTFDAETFTITIKVVKTTKRELDWNTHKWYIKEN